MFSFCTTGDRTPGFTQGKSTIQLHPQPKTVNVTFSYTVWELPSLPSTKHSPDL